jgi:hypothetical protein
MVPRCISARWELILPHALKWDMTTIQGPKMVDHCMNTYGKIDSGATFAEQPVPILLYKIYWIML